MQQLQQAASVTALATPSIWRETQEWNFKAFSHMASSFLPVFPGPPSKASQWSACQGLSPHSRSSKVFNTYFLICGSRRELPGTGPVQLPAASGADQASTPPKPGCSFTSHTNAHDSPNSAPTLQTVQPDSHRTVSTALCHLPFIVTALGKKSSPPWLSTVSELLVLLFLECNSFLNI